MKITTARLVLREFETADWTAVLAYQSDPRYLRYYHWTERTPTAVQAFVRMFLSQLQEQPRLKFQLAVTLKANGQLIGNCGVRCETADRLQADLGYELAPTFWGQGFATEAAQAMLWFGFQHLQLHRIWAETVADNTGSARVLQKLGMKQEGYLRQNQYYKGRYWDTLLFGLLRPEWQPPDDYPPPLVEAISPTG